MGGEQGTEEEEEEEEEEESHPLLLGGNATHGESAGRGRIARVREYLVSQGHRPGAGKRSIVGALYGDNLPASVLPRVAWLSLTLAVIVGGFWLLDSLKDTVLERTIGMELQPRAKMVSVCVTLVAVILYSQLLDRMRRAALFYCVGWGFTALLTGVGLILSSPSIGIRSGTHSPILQAAGWISYVAIEAYGSVAVGLFWAFVNSSVGLEEAKSSYGLIIAGAQVGAIMGSTAATLTTLASGRVHVSTLYLVGAASPALMAVLIWGFERCFSDHLPHEVPRNVDAPQRGVFASVKDGFCLVTSYPYVATLLGVSCLYEVALTVLDYEMKVIGVLRFRSIDGGTVDADNEFATLMGHFGQITNGLALLMSLLGTSYVVRLLGLPTSLMIFPLLLVLAVIITYLWPSLWVLFLSVSVLKGLTYSLGEPCKEMLYMVTTDTIKVRRTRGCFAFFYGLLTTVCAVRGQGLDRHVWLPMCQGRWLPHHQHGCGAP
jgi:AAA family ATP:ADP antiporter